MAKSVKLWFGRLHDNDESLRRGARRVLAGLTPADKKAVPDLLVYLKSNDPTSRYWAARGLSGVGPDAKDAVPALIESLKDENEDCRFWAVTALSSIGAEALDAIPPLIGLLRDSVFGVRAAVAGALVRIAPTAESVLHALVEMLETDENEYVREEVIRALGKIGTAGAVSALVNALNDRNLDVRRYAAIGLKMLGSKAKQAIPEIKRIMTTDLSDGVRGDLEIALNRMESE